MLFRDQIVTAYKDIQDQICRSLEQADGIGKFEEEHWERVGGGGGRTRILQNGRVVEKGGVNFSAVHGQLPYPIKKAFGIDNNDFFATGVSIVIHPENPWVPIIHMNIRYFEVEGESDADTIRWFGGGIDLTPHYVIDEDAAFFHQSLKNTCDAFDPAFYPEFKTRADNYFFIKHRRETRGIGGIFYDRLQPGNSGLSWEQLFDFSVAVGQSFAPIYTELMSRNQLKDYTNLQKEWQYVRRSRYAEFNLVYDAGTKFGLETDGRIESILMSLPPTAKWIYDYRPLPESEEAATLDKLKKGIDWV